jgi:hypothetical protein
MKSTVNVPFTRKSGVEITKKTPYLSQGPNRRDRRYKEPRFVGNSKNHHLTVTRNGKYRRVVQITPDGKTINHYVAA